MRKKNTFSSRSLSFSLYGHYRTTLSYGRAKDFARVTVQRTMVCHRQSVWSVYGTIEGRLHSKNHQWLSKIEFLMIDPVCRHKMCRTEVKNRCFDIIRAVLQHFRLNSNELLAFTELPHFRSTSRLRPNFARTSEVRKFAVSPLPLYTNEYPFF